ncbi:hypothetical protein J437_LFUL001583 [Ladona fulva]|uniref:Transposase n=1 Tax=Ladona fulva TaxID=123851 RepID=A0A8K0P502_LADFU|nr:hypothetical protein J437_LFUL001583 [Ladona fulva]
MEPQPMRSSMQTRCKNCDASLSQNALECCRIESSFDNGMGIIPDNAYPYTANLMRDKLQRFGCETLQHPPYTPDHSPCDFHIFGDLKKDIRGRRFHTDKEVLEWVKLWVRQQPTSFYKTGIDHLISQWDKCINTFGNYF